MLLDFNELSQLDKIKSQPISQEVKRVYRKYKKVDEKQLVKLNKRFKNVKTYDFERPLNFYDFEVFEYDWMVVIINTDLREKRIICNDAEALEDYYYSHKNEIWVGYNSRNYDVYILKSILLGLNPKETNDLLILDGKKGWEISERFKDISLLNFDIYLGKGLKVYEGFMGNDITETSVPFDIDRVLTVDEIMETIKYCSYDVTQTIEVFKQNKEKFDSHIDLITTSKLPMEMINLTQAQITANIIGCEKKEHFDEFDIQFVKSLRIKKYQYIVDWFKNKKNYNYDTSLVTDVCGIPHTFGWGGLHGCSTIPIHTTGRIFHVDVTSYYPSIMIEYDFLTRNCKDKKKFKQIYDKRVELKKQGKKREQMPLKICLNGCYGITKDKYSKAYDPRQANNVCINGQLMLLDLLEHLENYAEIIQSNTDGIILKVADNDRSVEKMKFVCQEWMNRTGMGLGFDEISEIWQKDVNNYIFKFTSGKLERKGAYVMELDDFNYDLPIVNKAIVNYLVNNISVEKTIGDCNDLREFQKIVKISSNYLVGWHNGKYLQNKVFRVFASSDISDTYIGRCKYIGATIEKFADTSNHCFIYNEDVHNVSVPNKLDKTWYINLARKRINDFGNFDKNSLF